MKGQLHQDPQSPWEVTEGVTQWATRQTRFTRCSRISAPCCVRMAFSKVSEMKDRRGTGILSKRPCPSAQARRTQDLPSASLHVSASHWLVQAFSALQGKRRLCEMFSISYFLAPSFNCSLTSPSKLAYRTK